MLSGPGVFLSFSIVKASSSSLFFLVDRASTLFFPGFSFPVCGNLKITGLCILFDQDVGCLLASAYFSFVFKDDFRAFWLFFINPSVTRSATKMQVNVKLGFFSRRLWTWDKRQTKSATVRPQICNYSATFKPLLFFQRDGPRAIAPRVTGLV